MSREKALEEALLVVLNRITDPDLIEESGARMGCGSLVGMIRTTLATPPDPNYREQVRLLKEALNRMVNYVSGYGNEDGPVIRAALTIGQEKKP